MKNYESKPMTMDYKQQNNLLVEKRKRRDKIASAAILVGCVLSAIGIVLICAASQKIDVNAQAVEKVVETPVVYYDQPIPETPVAEIAIDVIEATEPDILELYRDEIVYIAKTVYGEARGCSKTEQAAVIWSILNRVDSELRYMPDDIISVVTQAHQYVGYNSKHPVTDEFVDLAKDVLSRWVAEKNGETNVGRVLPKNYLWFYGDGKHNHFTDEWRNGNKWDWSLESPYDL